MAERKDGRAKQEEEAWPSPYAGDADLPLPERNLASWRRMIAFYEDFVAQRNWKHLMPLLRLVRQIADTDLARSFRAGQSLWYLLISTADFHGLTHNDPFVVVNVDQRQRFEIEYHDRELPGTIERDRLERRVCDEAEVVSVLTAMLERLWNDTRGRGDLTPR